MRVSHGNSAHTACAKVFPAPAVWASDFSVDRSVFHLPMGCCSSSIMANAVVIRQSTQPQCQSGPWRCNHGAARHQVVNVHLMFLANAVDPSDSLFNAHGVPWDIEVDHPVTELQVEPFAPRLCAHQDRSTISRPTPVHRERLPPCQPL